MSENVSEGVSEGEVKYITSNHQISLNQQKIIAATKSNNRITYTELSELIGIAPTNIARNIKKLVEAEKLRRVGPAKGGYWEVLS